MGGAVVQLSANNPVASGVQAVSSTTGIPQDGTVRWSDVGPTFTSVASGSVVPVAGLPGVNMTISTATGQPGMTLINCPAMADCAFFGNFAPAEPLLWVSGIYDGGSGTWTPNGPLTLTLSTPQRGVGFRIMADEPGAFSGTVCAYNAADTLLGCVPLTGTGEPIAGNANSLAAYTGIYDDAAEISKVTIDASGAQYPHDFAIGELTVASARRMVPQSVMVPAGASSATFPVNTDAVASTIVVDVTGDYLATHAGSLTINPAP